MSYSETNLNVCVYWYDRALQGGEFLEQVRAFLEKIQLNFPEFSNFRVVRDPKESDGLIDRDFSNLDDQVIASLPKDWAYLNPDSTDKKFTRKSTAAVCFSTALLVAPNAKTGMLSIDIKAGRPVGRSSDLVIIEIDPELESPQFARELFRMCIEFWQPHHGHVGRYQVERLLNQPTGEIRVGWLTYLADITARKALPRDLSSEPLFAGVLIQATEVPGFPDDEKGIQNMRRILEALRGRGFLTNPQKKLTYRSR